MQRLYRLIRPLVFQFDPEFAHKAATFFLKTPFFRGTGLSDSRLETRIFSKTLSSPVALAAGYDKDGTLTGYLPSLGFSYAELGTFTKSAQEGNPRKRLFRLPEEEAIFNRMGFNNPGINAGISNIQSSPGQNIFALSIGKSKETVPEKAAEDYLEIIEKIHGAPREFQERILYLAINISSPNTPGLRDLQNKAYLKKLLRDLRAATNLYFAVKFSPDFEDDSSYQRAVEAAVESGVDGIIVTNTTTEYRLAPSLEERIATRGGGVSGAPLRTKSLEYLQKTLKITEAKVRVFSSGGVMTPEDVWQRLLYGADIVQLYTGIIYYGPSLARDSAKYILRQMEKYGFSSLDEVKNHGAELLQSLSVKNGN